MSWTRGTARPDRRSYDRGIFNILAQSLRISICFAQTTATAHKRQTISQLPAEYFILDDEARKEVLQFIRLKQETHLDKAREKKLKKLKK